MLEAAKSEDPMRSMFLLFRVITRLLSN